MNTGGAMSRLPKNSGGGFALRETPSLLSTTGAGLTGPFADNKALAFECSSSLAIRPQRQTATPPTKPRQVPNRIRWLPFIVQSKVLDHAEPNPFSHPPIHRI